MDSIIFDPLFVGPQYQTMVWVAEAVQERIEEFMQDEGEKAAAYMDKVEYYAKAGFHRHEGDRRGIRGKWGGILAIEPWATLFRLYGFYEQAQKRDFLIASCTMKRGGKMSKHDKEEVNYAVYVKEHPELWQKRMP